MSAKLHRYNPLRLFSSVPLGITLMALIALYLAAGSGRQWLRSTGVDQWPGVRDWFDKTDLEFFNAWPLKLLMALLVVNLVVVTWRKIPLTPPRYGVWCVHAGIITLVLGTAAYYGNKLEGRVRIYTDPAVGRTSVDHYYDKDERALYVRTGRDIPAAFPLPTLPRFQQYDEAMGNADSLRRRGLWDIVPTLPVGDLKRGSVDENLAEMVYPLNELPKDNLRVDVVGFYPYANVNTNFDYSDPASKVTGVELSMGDPNDPQTMQDWYVVASDPRFKTDTNNPASSQFMEAQHVDEDAAKVRDAADHLFELDVAAPGLASPVALYVKPGQTVPVGTSGYTLQVESYNPSWSMFGSGEPVPALQMLVTSPKQKFRRMVLQGKTTQTDFQLGVAGAGPMGKRMSKGPLDPGLNIVFRVSDPLGLLPQERTVRHTLVTPAGAKGLLDVEVKFNGTSAVHDFPDGSGDVLLAPPTPEEMGAPPGADGGPAASADHPSIHVHLQRHDHLDPQDSVVPVPPARRESQADEDGKFQVVKLRVHMGAWSRDVVVPYTSEAADRLRQDPWSGGYVTLPGAVAPLQFQLGNTQRPLPATLTLDQFKVVPFPGGSDTPDAFIQDYRSTVTLSGADDSETDTEVASLNHPIYFDGGRWLFFQAAYDPNVPHAWTQLGVGNRPAVRVMVSGCIMIFGGLVYAFYVKPVIVRRMKQRALAAAAASGRFPVKSVPAAEPELVGS